MIGTRLKTKVKGDSDAQVVGQRGGLWVLVPIEGGAPFELSPAAIAGLYDVGGDVPTPPVADENAGWGALAEAERLHRFAVALPGESPGSRV